MNNNNLMLFSIGALIVLVFTILSVFAFQHAIKKEYGSKKERALWSFIAVFPFVGWLIYFVFGFRKGTKIDFD